MASYYRRSYRSLRPRRRYRRYFRRKFRSYARKFVNGSSRSSIRLKVPVSLSVSWTQDANTIGSTPTRICPMFDSSRTSSALTSTLYRTYCGLYDEMKVIGMKARLNISSQIGGTDIPSLQIYSGFDRRYGYGETAPTFAELKTYSTYSCATAVNNSVAKLERSIYASDLMERAQWHDCSLEDTAGVYSDKAYHTAGENPNFFVPALFLAIAVPGQTEQKTVNGTVDVTYYFAFRNPKYGGSAGANRLAVEDVDAPVRGVGRDGDQGGADVADEGDAMEEEDVAAVIPDTIPLDPEPSGLRRPQNSLGINPKKTARVVRAGKN